MDKKCVGKPRDNNLIYIHPLYDIINKKNKNNIFGEKTGYICPTKFYFNNNEILIEKEADINDEYDIFNNDFNIDIFLYTIYNIKTLDDAINWTKDNYSEHRLTIYRIWDLVWDSKIKKELLEDYDKLDELIKLYIDIFSIKENIKIDYKNMYDAIIELVNTHLGANYSEYPGKSYQKEIKNLLHVYK